LDSWVYTPECAILTHCATKAHAEALTELLNKMVTLRFGSDGA
jgi:hypothetical protein